MERFDDDFVKFKNLCGIPESVNSREEIEKIMMSRVRDRRLRRLRQRQRNQTKGKKRYSEQELQKKKSKTSKTSKKENSQEPDLLKIMATSEANFQRIFNPRRGKKRYSEQELQELQKKKSKTSKTSKKENSQESQVDPDLRKIMATSEANFQRIFNPRRGKNFLFRIMFWDMCLLSSIIV